MACNFTFVSYLMFDLKIKENWKFVWCRLRRVGIVKNTQHRNTPNSIYKLGVVVHVYTYVRNTDHLKVKPLPNTHLLTFYWWALHIHMMRTHVSFLCQKKGKTLLEFLATRIDTAIDNDFTLYLSVNYLVYSLLVDK